MYYRSTVLTDFLHLVVCNVYDEFGGKIGSVSLHWDSLNDLKVNVFSVTSSTWLFKDHPQGTKEPHRTPAWLSEIWPCVSVMKYQFIFGVCDGRQRLKTLYYLFQTSLCVLLPIYCSVTVLLFWKTNWIGSDQRLKRLYRVLISWTRATLTSAIKLLLCETGLYLSSGLGGCICVELKEHELWVMCIQCNIYSSLFHLVIVQWNVQSEIQAHALMYNLYRNRKMSPHQCYCCQMSPEKVMKHENVNSNHSQFYLDDLQCIKAW